MKREERQSKKSSHKFNIFNSLFVICYLLFFILSCDNPFIIAIVEPKTATFESNGGSNVENQTVFKGQPVRKPSNPSRSGFTFDAWYSDNETFLEEWDFNAIPNRDITLYAKWKEVIAGPGDPSGAGTEENPFLVNNETELRRVGRGDANPAGYTEWTLDKYYRQTVNITLIQGDWTRIGTDDTNSFTGTYNGDGHTVTGLTINATNQYQGMFGFIDTGSRVENLGLINVNISGNDCVGGIAGYNRRGTIQNCYVSGSVTGTDYSVGGIVGSNSGTIQNCYVSGSVTGTTSDVGGIVGFNSDGTIQNCSVSGSVEGSGIRTGGIAGDNYGTLTGGGGVIQNCYVSGSVTGTNNYVGGIVGYNSYGGTIQSGTIQNCYVSGSVKGNNYVGGIAGYNWDTIKNCIALNQSVTITGTGTTIGRITGSSGGTQQNNYAWKSMKLTRNDTLLTVTPSPDGKDGADITAAEARTQAAWTAAGFTFGGDSPWVWNAQYSRPVLKNEVPQAWPEYLVDTVPAPTTWTAVADSTFGTSYIRSIAYGNNRFVAVGDSGKMAYSTDNGVTWTAVTNSPFGNTATISAIAYGSDGNAVNTWVAVGAIGGNGIMAYSTDGVTWQAVTDSTFGSSSITRIAYGNNRFVAGGYDGKMAYSSDGINWTAVANSTFGSSAITEIAYGNGTFVAGGQINKMAYSTDGVTWQAVTDSTLGSSSNINAIAYGNDGNAVNRFVIGGFQGKMAYSPDGITWTAVADSTFGTTVTIYDIAYANNRFVAVGGSAVVAGDGKMAYSPDGINWTAVADSTFGTSEFRDIAYGGGRFVAGGASGKMAYCDWP